MFYSQQRHALRQQFFDAFALYQNNAPLSPLEKLIVEVILAHPEYLPLFENPSQYIDKNYSPEMGETNPFLHMSAHLSLKEQVRADRPHGIQKIYRSLLKKYQQDESKTEHLMMECLMEVLYQAQKTNSLADEKIYLKALKKL